MKASFTGGSVTESVAFEKNIGSPRDLTANTTMSGVKRPGEGEGPDSSKKAYGGPSADLMDAEPELPEEYEDPDDDDVFLNDVMDQKVRDGVDRSVPSFFQTKPRPSQPRRSTSHTRTSERTKHSASRLSVPYTHR